MTLARLAPLAALLALAAPLASAAPAEAAPAPAQPKTGLWRLTSKTMGMSMTMKMCVDETTARNGGAYGGKRPGADCTPGAVVPIPGGVRFSSTCRMQGGMTMQTSGTATGDFTTSYKVNSTTVMSGGGAGGMPPIQTQMDFTYAGPCPAGAKPGELVR